MLQKRFEGWHQHNCHYTPYIKVYGLLLPSSLYVAYPYLVFISSTFGDVSPLVSGCPMMTESNMAPCSRITRQAKIKVTLITGPKGSQRQHFFPRYVWGNLTNTLFNLFNFLINNLLVKQLYTWRIHMRIPVIHTWFHTWQLLQELFPLPEPSTEFE